MNKEFNLTDIGGLHNYLCDKILAVDDKNLPISTEVLSLYMEVCAKELVFLFSNEKDAIIKAIGEIETYFKSFDEDENGANKLFSQHIYTEKFIVDFTNRFVKIEEFRYLLIELHRLYFDTCAKKSNVNDIIDKIKKLPQSESIENFLDVYNSSYQYWYSKGNQLKKEYPPDGISCDEWIIIMDAIGATAGGFLGIAMSAIFSIAASRECEEREQHAETKKSSIRVNIYDAFYMESIFTKKMFIDDKFVGSFTDRSKAFEKPEKARNIRIELLGGFIKSDCNLPETKTALEIDFCNYHYRILTGIFVGLIIVLVASYILLDISASSKVFIIISAICLFLLICLIVFRNKRYNKRVR